jgi:integrase
VLADQLAIPRFWAAVWAALLPGDLAPSTVSKHLSDVESLYRYADELLGYGGLDKALASLNVEALSQALEGYFLFLRNRPNATAVSETRWQVVSRFTTDILTRLGRTDPPHPKLADLETKLARIEAVFSNLRVGSRRMPEPTRSLPAEVEALYELLDPASSTNPFRGTVIRWRVYTAYLLLLHLGLRRGELLALAADAIKSGFDKKLGRRRSWLTVKYNPYEDDPRYSRPSIKTVDSLRQVPISEHVVAVVDEYAANYRGRPGHSFLLNSQKKNPLSTEALTDEFQKITTSLPSGVLKALYDRTGKDSVTPHDLRHTCAVLRLKQLLSDGVSMEEALQLLRAYLGWERSSLEPLKYARAVFEDRLGSVWRREFDERVEVLRNLEEAMK